MAETFYIKSSGTSLSSIAISWLRFAIGLARKFSYDSRGIATFYE